MKTEVAEIADKIYRLSTFLPQVGPTGFTFNQFLIDADQPLLFHYGQRSLFPLIAPPSILRVAVCAMSSISLRRRFHTSSLGRDIVEPSDCPRGMMVTLCNGCV